MLKKIAAALLAAMMALSLTACSGGDEKQESYTGKAYESEILTPGEIVVGVSADYPPYNGTRAFYRKEGFLPLEVFPTFWDEDNPCLFLARTVK